MIILLLISFVGKINSQQWLSKSNLPEELGNVHWIRDYYKGLDKAKKLKKPIFLFFQEVPGCATCKNYGNNLLQHPLVVEAIETYFVPIAIYNNKPGADAKILQKFNEPSWNNPVARIISHTDEKDIIKRLNGKYDLISLVDFISKGMLESNQLIPEYLNIMQSEYSTSNLRETHLSMFCFWTGEKVLGDLDGIVETKAGFMNNSEVVKVKYDVDKINEQDLLAFASKKKCADAVYSDDQRIIKAAKKENIRTAKNGKFRADKESKYYLYNSPYRAVPMTHLQTLKVNTALSKRMPIEEFLSPRQLELAEMIQQKKMKLKNNIDQDIIDSWADYLQ